jgi:hypothetical protein
MPPSSSCNMGHFCCDRNQCREVCVSVRAKYVRTGNRSILHPSLDF